MFAADRDVFRVAELDGRARPDAVGEARSHAARQIRAERDGPARRSPGRAGPAARGPHAPSAPPTSLWLLTGFDAFDALYTGRGLSADETAEILQDVAERALLA